MAKSKIFYGWWIIILLFITYAYGGATIWFGFTAFFNPLIKEFAWSYTAISVAASIRGAEFGIMDIVVGFLVDRFSIRRIILIGSILVGTGWLILSRVNSLEIFYISFIIICIGATGIGGVVFYTLLTRWFHKRLGLAIGLTMSGPPAGAFAVPAIVSLLDLIGFRPVFFIFGVTAIIIGSTAAYFVRDWPRDMGSVPDGIPHDHIENMPERLTVANDVSPQTDFTLREAISKSTFWIITYVSIAAIFSWITIITHIMPYLEHLGYSRGTASLAATMLPVISMGGRLFTGWISDRITYRKVLILAVSGQVISVILCYYANIAFALILFVVLLGITYGSINVLRPISLRRYYGATYIGSILGVCSSLAQLGGITGPIFAGWIFDVRGSYNFVWIIASILLLAGIPLVAMLEQSK